MASLTSARLGAPTATIQAETTLPYEIRLMVFKNCNLDSIKSLRLVSKTWATVGLDVLLLPNFVISPARHDIQRLLSISQHPQLSHLAANTIKTLTFINSDFDVAQFRIIFSNRVESTSTFLPNSFVPTKFEQEALDQLDSYEANLASIHADNTIDRLVLALKAVPNYQSIIIPSPCPFAHGFLKRTWAEFAPGLCLPSSSSSSPPQILNILNAINQSKLRPKSLYIAELDSSFAAKLPSDFGEIAKNALKDLENLTLRIEDTYTRVTLTTAAEEKGGLKDMVRAFLDAPKLQSLDLTIQPPASSSWPLTYLPPAQNFPHLQSLRLCNASFKAPEFLTYLSMLSPTLKHVQFMGMQIVRCEMRWRQFLEGMRELRLERFLLGGSTWFVDAEGERRDIWHLQPWCASDWTVFERNLGGKSWLLNEFVVGEGEWPMREEDDDALPSFGDY